MMFANLEELLKKSESPASTVGERICRYAGIFLNLSIMVGLYIWIHPN